MPLLPSVPRRGDRSHYGCIVWKMSAWHSSHQGVSSSIVRLQMPAGCRFSLGGSQRFCRGNRIGSPGESAATLRLCSPALVEVWGTSTTACRSVRRSFRRSFSAPLVPPPIALSGFPAPKQRSRSDTSVAGKYPITTYSPSPTPAPDTQKPQPPRECGNCGIAQSAGTAQTTGDCGPWREPALSTRYLTQRRAPSTSLHDVVRGLDGHLDIVRVAFLQPGRGEADELALGLEIIDGARADVEHRLPQTAG